MNSSTSKINITTVLIWGMLFGTCILLWTIVSLINLDNMKYEGLKNKLQTEHLRQLKLVAVDGPETPGYGGTAVKLDKKTLSPDDLMKYKIGYARHNFNQMASDMISVNRKILNVTEPECLKQQYDYKSLPKAGVVIIFHNEAPSVLVRSIHSVLNTASPELLTEIVVVDDASTHEILHTPLTNYLQTLQKVRLIRLSERMGLMAARMEGFKHVTGEAVIFLDSHVEMAEGWMEHLLSRIAKNQNILAVPGIDRIHGDDFSYQAVPAEVRNIGGFDLDMYYSWIPNRNKAKCNNLLPMRSPTHLGCCFAISVKTFKRLGQYDAGLRIWGCENMELTFKVWMCGGHIEIIPCSHVGHLFRHTAPYDYGREGYDVIQRNCLRVAEVWMDDYKYFYYDRIFNQQDKIDVGNITERKKLRHQLSCHSFQWYLKNAYPELYLPFHWTASGQIKNKGFANLCVESAIHWVNYGQPAYVDKCDNRNLIQHFTLTKERQIRRDDGCLDVSDSRVVVIPCDTTTKQGWVYTQDNTIVHILSGKCLTLTRTELTLVVTKCDHGKPEQQWTWKRHIPNKIRRLEINHNKL